MQQLVCLPNPTQYIKCKCNNVVEYSYTLLTQNSSVVSAFCCAWLKVSQTLSHAICCAWLIASEFVGHAFCCACAINCVTLSLGNSESYIQLLFWSSWLQSCSELVVSVLFWALMCVDVFQSKNILVSQTAWDLKRHTSCYAYLRHEPDLLSFSILFWFGKI